MPSRETGLRRGRSILLLACATLAQACSNGAETYAPGSGNADAAFADQGLFRLDPDALWPSADGVHATTDAAGNVWAAGSVDGAGPVGTTSKNAVLLRLRANGTPDPDFAGAGYILDPPEPVTGAFQGLYGRFAMPVAGDGATLAESAVRPPCKFPPCHGESGMTQRVHANGAIDVGYGDSGRSPAVLDSMSHAVADSRGGIVFVGKKVPEEPGLPPDAGLHWNVLARVDGQGRVDADFAARATGALECPVPPTEYAVTARIALQADGRLLVAQTFGPYFAGASSICLARIHPDGTLDVGYGGSGRVLLDDPLLVLDTVGVLAVSVAGDGGAALALTKRTGGSPQVHSYVVVALTAQGAVDVARYDRGYAGRSDGLIAQATAVALQADGKVLVAGFPGIGAAPSWQDVDRTQPRLERLGRDGRPDPAFGPGGQGYAPLAFSGYALDPAHVHVAGASIFVAGTAARSLATDFTGHRHLAVAKFVGG